MKLHGSVPQPRLSCTQCPALAASLEPHPPRIVPVAVPAKTIAWHHTLCRLIACIVPKASLERWCSGVTPIRVAGHIWHELGGTA